MRSNHAQQEGLDNSPLAPRALDTSLPSAGDRLLGKLLVGAGVVLVVPGWLLVLFVGAGWMSEAGGGGVVNPNTPLFFFLGVLLVGGSIWMALVGARLSRRP